MKKLLFIIGFFFLLFIYICVVEVTEVVVIYLSVFPKYNNTISISYFDYSCIEVAVLYYYIIFFFPPFTKK